MSYSICVNPGSQYDTGASVVLWVSGWRYSSIVLPALATQCPTNQIVKKFDIRNRIWLVKNTSLMMLTMLAAMLAAPVSYCEPGLIHACTTTHQWLTSSFNPWRSPVGGFEKPSDGSSDVFLCSCESLLSLSLWLSLLANDVGDSLLWIVVFIALRVYGSASFSVFLLFLGHWLYILTLHIVMNIYIYIYIYI